MVDTNHLLPGGEEIPKTPERRLTPRPGVPSKKAQSWGAVISIVIIVEMIVTGAFYAWGKRITEQNYPGLAPAAVE